MQQANQLVPCIDIQNNPFYCPAVPARNFITSLRRKRKHFRSKIHTYRDHQFVLKPFAAALDRCLFKGGGDSGRPSHFPYGSEGDSSGEDELHKMFPPLNSTTSAHTSSKHGISNIEKGSTSTKTARLNSTLRKGTGDSPNSGSFVTVPLAPAVSPTNKKYSAWSGLTTLHDRSGRPLITTRRNRNVEPHTLSLWKKLSLESQVEEERTSNFKRKSSDSDSTSDFSELHTKRAKSNLSVSDGSFYVTVRREKLRFLRTSTSSTLHSTLSSASSEIAKRYSAVEIPTETLRAGMRISIPRSKDWSGPLSNMQGLGRDDLLELAGALQDELFGPCFGSEAEIKELVDKLDSILPGIRIKERLIERLESGTNHQTIVNFLAENGHLNSRILELFRSSKVTHMSLSESFKDVNGLNLISDDLFFAFSKPNSFCFLTTLSLDGLCLKTPTLSHIQHLPKLATLSLYDTGIKNEAIYLLVSLKYTLADLIIARNPAIDDDAVPALLMLSNLSYLSIAETSIEMPGARRLVKDRMIKGRQISIDFPHWCHDYIDAMESKFLLELAPPLVSNPSLCSRLSVAALKRNLAAHAAVNRDVSTEGTKKEMVERLRTLLETRLVDLEVRWMLRKANSATQYHDVIPVDG